MVAQQVDMTPSELIWHLYLDHMEMAETLLSREPRPFPTLTLTRKPLASKITRSKISKWWDTTHIRRSKRR